MAVVGKITSKGRTTVPRRIREALGVGGRGPPCMGMSGDGAACARGVKALDLGYQRALGGTVAE